VDEQVAQLVAQGVLQFVFEAIGTKLGKHLVQVKTPFVAVPVSHPVKVPPATVA
jgi:hypothetical protein